MATTWYGDGWVLAYDDDAGNFTDTISLISSGLIDTEGVTRGQYDVGEMDRWRFNAKIRFDRADFNAAAAANPNVRLAVAAYIASASALPAEPTPSDVFLQAVSTQMVFLSAYSPTPPPGGFVNADLNVTGPSPSQQLSPNTKYWVLLLPVSHIPGQPAYTAWSLASYSAAQVRAVSLWTNRTPAAPAIASPMSGIVVSGGESITLAINETNDPDTIMFSSGYAPGDRAGVQVQYAPQPSAANPNPTWVDMGGSDVGTGTFRDRGWWIKGANDITGTSPWQLLSENSTVGITCGATTADPGEGFLPAGSWQIRVRTFDYGHPIPSLYNPLGPFGPDGAYTPSTYPATNTSAWSAPVFVTVAAQVPPPIPTFPIGNVAVPDNDTAALAWQYRNTAVPPFPQASRSVRIRKVGDSAWTDLVVNQASALTTLTINPLVFDLVSGNRYEWQVQVTDTDDVTSNWSESAFFWVVPAAGSGGTRPVPTETVDGATLGCGTHRVEIYRRGGTERVGELTGITHVDWARVRDDISTAKVVVQDWDVDCGNLLAQLQTWAYELVITRDNGYSRDRVWEGPITLLTYEVNSVTIQAKDVMGYAYRRIIKQKMSDAGVGDTVTSRAARILQNAFAPDDPNVLAYLQVLPRSDDAKQYRTTAAYSRTAFEEVDDMASNAGLDYCAVGRSILLWGTKHRIGTLPEFRDKDLGSPPIVSEYGMSMANRYAVGDGNGVWGEATRLNEDGQDPVYGLVEMLSSSWASDSTPEEGTYTQEGLNKIRESFAESSERSIADRYPPPVVVRVPDNTTLNPDTVISIQHLVPGVAIPLRSMGTLRQVRALQKLDSVSVVEEAGKETISITLSPFSRDDGDMAEEGEGL